jgi:hypothetical protein
MAAPADTRREPLGTAGVLIASWGVLGILALLAQAMVRLTPLAIEPVTAGRMSSGQWALYVGWSLFNAYAEGYRGFQRAFCPRVVARAFYLARHPRPLHVLLAPLFCMAFFHAKPKNLRLAWGLFTLIVVLIVLVHMLPQPWRGIVDVGVVIGLGWGVVATVALFVAALLGEQEPQTDSIPEPAAAAAA